MRESNFSPLRMNYYFLSALKQCILNHLDTFKTKADEVDSATEYKKFERFFLPFWPQAAGSRRRQGFVLEHGLWCFSCTKGVTLWISPPLPADQISPDPSGWGGGQLRRSKSTFDSFLRFSTFYFSPLSVASKDLQAIKPDTVVVAHSSSVLSNRKRPALINCQLIPLICGSSNPKVHLRPSVPLARPQHQPMWCSLRVSLVIGGRWALKRTLWERGAQHGRGPMSVKCHSEVTAPWENEFEKKKQSWSDTGSSNSTDEEPWTCWIARKNQERESWDNEH